MTNWFQGGSPPPPSPTPGGLSLRKDSAITEALNVAKDRIRLRLQEATKKYFQAVGDAAETARRAFTTIPDLPAVRKEVVERENGWSQQQARAYKQLEAAMQEFDLDMRELEAWVVAATASDKLRPQETKV